eukprot:Pgem_evm1s1241
MEATSNLPRRKEGSSFTTYESRLEVVKQYHNHTHNYPNNVEKLVRSIGRFNWDDLPELVYQADQECLHCELNQIHKKGYHPLKSIRAEFAGDKWVIDLIPLPKDLGNPEGEKRYILHIRD